MENNLTNDTDQEDFVDVETTDVPLPEIEPVTFTEQTALSDTEMRDILNDPNNKPPEIDYDSVGEFCFESDQLALKGNSDYKNLLEALVVLEAQKIQAVKDLERLVKLKEEALADPFQFLERLQRKENMNFPAPQKIHPVPVIDWSKYALSGNPIAFRRRQMNLQRQRAQDMSKNNAKTKLSTPNNESKSMEINQVWSNEEQKLLKELLMEFPPEEDEACRWEKIANGLKTKTPLEVASRVNKCYATLADDNVILLGKIPDLIFLRKHWNPEIVEQSNIQDQPKNTEECVMESEISILDDEDLSPDLQNSAEYQELVCLKRLLRERESEESNNLVQHTGFKCCHCKSEPIIGVRWHCSECPSSLSIDFCDDCSRSMYETAQHTADHHLERIHASKGFLDRDYMHFLGSDYNYLDPNYMPAI